eukprot:GHVL01026751.1.p1 GENE.GHVL01026751.1~~GHVL01026751.1.p1  ORF type:complete len:603 (+),score=124.51 GHVL01026751.1:23-1810(+)
MNNDENITFLEMGKKYLDRRILKAVSKIGITVPTPIQLKAIPAFLEGRNVVARAPTGSGKTLAFAIPVIEILLKFEKNKNIQSLVIVPTKELSYQILQVFNNLLHFCDDLTVAEINQKASKEISNIMIGTPSAATNLIKELNLNIEETLRVLVIDEADLIFSYGYEEDIKELAKLLPPGGSNIQYMLSSATMSCDVDELQQLLLYNPEIITIEPSHDSLKIQQLYITCEEADKWLLLYAIVKLDLVPGKMLIYCSSLHRAYSIKLFFDRFGIPAGVLNAALPKSCRHHAIQRFNEGIFRLLIATDDCLESDKKKNKDSSDAIQKKVKSEEFASHRGLDLVGVGSVINVDMPKTLKAYIHRIGRTARAGASGVALSLACPMEEDILNDIKEHFSEKHYDGETINGLNLNVSDVACYRYRVEDMLRGVTKKAVNSLRAREIRREALNSSRLQNHFSNNPKDAHSLKKASGQLKEPMSEHLKHLPDYLVPTGTAIQSNNPVLAALEKQTPAGVLKKNVPKRPRHADYEDTLLDESKKKSRSHITRESQIAKEQPDSDPLLLPGISRKKIYKLRKGLPLSKKGRPSMRNKSVLHKFRAK